MKHVILRTESEIDTYRDLILQAARATVERLQRILSDEASLAAFGHMKFEAVGADPLDPSRGLNLIEQINQTFTYLVSLEGARRLLRDHPSEAPFELNLGTRGGYDIQSTSGTVIAEAFAAVDPRNNSKLDRDVERVRNADARYKYVFLCSQLPQYEDWIQDGVTVAPMPLSDLLTQT